MRYGTYRLFLMALLAMPGSLMAREQMQLSTEMKDTSAINAAIKCALPFLRSANTNDSIEHLLYRSLEASRRLTYYDGICYSLMGLATCNTQKGNYSLALSLYREAEKNNKEGKKFHTRQGMIELQKANVFDGLGMYDSVVYYSLRALDIDRKYYTHLGNMVYRSLGVTFEKLRNYKQALAYLDSAEQGAIKDGDSSLLAAVLSDKGTVSYYEEKSTELSQSVYYTTQALAIAKATHSNNAAINALSNLAGYAMNATPPDYEKALYYLEQADSLKGADIFGQIYIWTNKGVCYSHFKNFGQAFYFLNKAERLAAKANSKYLLATVYHAMVSSYKNRGDYKNALHYAELYQDLQDSLKGTEVSQKVNQIQFRFETIEKDNQLTKKELQIAQQQIIIHKKDTFAWALISGVTAITLFIGLYYRYRIKIERQAERQAIEIAAWQASLEGEEKERKRLAKELHDNIAGNLSTVRMWFGNIRANLDTGIAGQEKEYGDALQMLENILNEVRNTAHHLMPELILRFGLAEAIGIFCNNIRYATGITIKYQYLGYVGNMSNSMQLLIFRTVQELVQNVLKHAEASYILVQLSQYDAILSLTIEDNGKGIDKERAGNSSGMGLSDISNNVEKLGGSFSISSEKGNGTTVEIEINTLNAAFS